MQKHVDVSTVFCVASLVTRYNSVFLCDKHVDVLILKCAKMHLAAKLRPDL